MNRVFVGAVACCKSHQVFAVTNFVPVLLHEICEFSSAQLTLINMHKIPVCCVCSVCVNGYTYTYAYVCMYIKLLFWGINMFHLLADMFEQRWGFPIPTVSHAQCMRG